MFKFILNLHAHFDFKDFDISWTVFEQNKHKLSVNIIANSREMGIYGVISTWEIVVQYVMYVLRTHMVAEEY